MIKLYYLIMVLGIILGTYIIGMLITILLGVKNPKIMYKTCYLPNHITIN